MIVRSPGLRIWIPAWHRVAPPHDAGRSKEALRNPRAAGEARAVNEVVAVPGGSLAAVAERDGTILRVWLRGNAADAEAPADDAEDEAAVAEAAVAETPAAKAAATKTASAAAAGEDSAAAELTGPVARLLERVHAEAVRLGIALAVVDLRQLERVGSACLRALGAWLAQLEELDAARRYEVKLVFEPGLRCHHFGARRCFAIDLTRVTEHR